MQYGTIVIKGSFASIEETLQEKISSVASSGSIFVLFRTEYGVNNDVEHDFFDVISKGVSLGLCYINTIIAPATKIQDSDLPDNVEYIVWFVKDHDKMFFDKDAIRESHIWKDVEWGHRAKNYNPKGKDPGNVWIPTEDDGKGNITKHIFLGERGVVERIHQCTAQEDLGVLLVSDDAKDISICPEGAEFAVAAKHESRHQLPAYTKKASKSIVTPIKKPWGKVIWGTSETMPQIPDNAVKCVITSPPYWDLKDYYKKGQIGQESYQQYLDRLALVWKECYDKLTDDGTFWLNINIRVKNNKVILIPRDFVKQCKQIGFHYKGILIWHKSSGIPTHDKNIVDRHEYVLVFSKSERLNCKEQMEAISDYKHEDINHGLFWNINRKAGSVGKKYIHPAIYPNDLVSRIVKCGTQPGDIVLDPFLGSGTTMIASILANRNCYGFEYYEGFKELIESRFYTDIGKSIDYDLVI